MGKVTEMYHKYIRGQLTPDFIVELLNGERVAGTWSDPEYCRKALQIITFLKQFDKVLLIAPYDNLKKVCKLLALAAIEPKGKFQTADIGYFIGLEGLERRLDKVEGAVNEAKHFLLRPKKSR